MPDTRRVQQLPTGPHRRYDPLRDEWILVSAGRTDRPWLGSEEPPPPDDRPPYDPTCYLCPGNARAGGQANPPYKETFVFTNDFAALRPDTDEVPFEDGVLKAAGEAGTCRVLCFSPRHDASLAGLGVEGVRRVIDVWSAQTAELGERYRWVQVFENRGAAMGASNPHPHGQIWAGTALPRDAAKEDSAQRRYAERHGGRALLLDYAAQEADGPRVVDADGDWLVVVPFWASWPFETLILPRVPVRRLPELDDARRDSLAAMLVRHLERCDALFARPFPYSMGWHGAPFGSEGTEGWQLHAHVYPPLLRASVRKFMVGYELLAETQRDITAEEAAARLRSAGRAVGPPASVRPASVRPASVRPGSR